MTSIQISSHFLVSQEKFTLLPVTSYKCEGRFFLFVGFIFALEHEELGFILSDSCDDPLILILCYFDDHIFTTGSVDTIFHDFGELILLKKLSQRRWELAYHLLEPLPIVWI